MKNRSTLAEVLIVGTLPVMLLYIVKKSLDINTLYL